MSPDLPFVVAVVILFALSISNIALGLTGERIRTASGKRLAGFGLIFLAAGIQLSVANDLIRASLLTYGVGGASLVAGCVVAGIAWCQTRDSSRIRKRE
ncbi:hypothetical protein [Halococcus hamelinensis]|uniref:hypothetical protein n=1 Tax=Halococcus hamelinensis TaxID=332168 RepID=UPI001ED8D1A8|nr:hypothetical protein [Halococcus hamelinensis]